MARRSNRIQARGKLRDKGENESLSPSNDGYSTLLFYVTSKVAASYRRPIEPQVNWLTHPQKTSSAFICILHHNIIWDRLHIELVYLVLNTPSDSLKIEGIILILRIDSAARRHAWYINSKMVLPALSPAQTEALRLIDEAHSQDPNRIDGPEGVKSVPYELHYAQKMTKWLESRCPDASPTLQIACRAQHFRRCVSVFSPQFVVHLQSWLPIFGFHHEIL
ncbi:hypothetical protein VFPPC_09799 [Pochonia chlamydosporia 170]|uniref:Uncharacterized protein n=1 Tax=Pochonia chlamydosporia 170 TaxID=1380566 RepID=A0A179FE65_METCM|nr:hypothetical protein VFPPC_09799 [Pochonia chlamydosporia 170]OAQ63541.1 hypothetical protein VFPPC_09799 [Pochonia chlamydosporia 170]